MLDDESVSRGWDGAAMPALYQHSAKPSRDTVPASNPYMQEDVKPIDLTSSPPPSPAVFGTQSPSPSLSEVTDEYLPSLSPTPQSKRIKAPFNVRGEGMKRSRSLSTSSSPTPTPTSRIKGEQDMDIKFEISPKKGKFTASTKSTGSVRGRGRPAGSKNRPKDPSTGTSGSDRKMGAWTKREVRERWDALGLLPIKVRWDEVAERVEGRDKLSCSNKWRYDLQPKLQAFIDSLGE